VHGGYAATLLDSACACAVHSQLLSTQRLATLMMAAMIGGVAASRAVAKADPRLSNEILRAVRRIVGEVGGEEGYVDGAGGKLRTTRKRPRGSRAALRQ
jgi:hypothetical protein